jgi:hypothetical protein
MQIPEAWASAALPADAITAEQTQGSVAELRRR